MKPHSQACSGRPGLKGICDCGADQPVHVDPKVRAWDCCGYSVDQAFREGARLLGEARARGSVGAAAPNVFDEALAQHRPGSVHTAPAWPWPGVFYQLSTGWVHIVADDRLEPGTARLVDAVSGKYVELRNLA